MNVYLSALKQRLDNGEIEQEIYNNMAEELKEIVEEPVEYMPEPTEIELLQEKNKTLEGAIMEISLALSMMMMGGM